LKLIIQDIEKLSLSLAVLLSLLLCVVANAENKDIADKSKTVTVQNSSK